MYGYTPPAVIAIDPEWFNDCGAFQRIAGAIEAQMRRRPVRVIVHAPERLLDAAPAEREALIESYYRDPRDVVIADPAPAVAAALAQHMQDLGAPLPVGDVATGHPARSGITCGTWEDAAQAARLLGTNHVVAWAREPEWVPDRVQGIPFRFESPGMAGLWDSAAVA